VKNLEEEEEKSFATWDTSMGDRDWSWEPSGCLSPSRGWRFVSIGLQLWRQNHLASK